jgi:hypothetical protein
MCGRGWDVDGVPFRTRCSRDFVGTAGAKTAERPSPAGRTGNKPDPGGSSRSAATGKVSEHSPPPYDVSFIDKVLHETCASATTSAFSLRAIMLSKTTARSDGLKKTSGQQSVFAAEQILSSGTLLVSGISVFFGAKEGQTTFLKSADSHQAGRLHPGLMFKRIEPSLSRYRWLLKPQRTGRGIHTRRPNPLHLQLRLLCKTKSGCSGGSSPVQIPCRTNHTDCMRQCTVRGFIAPAVSNSTDQWQGFCSKRKTLRKSLPLFHAFDVAPGHSASRFEERFSPSARDPWWKRGSQLCTRVFVSRRRIVFAISNTLCFGATQRSQ